MDKKIVLDIITFFAYGITIPFLITHFIHSNSYSSELVNPSTKARTFQRKEW